MDIDNSVIIKKVSDIISVLHTNPTAFGKQTGIDPGNLRRKLSKQLNFTSNDIIKMANVLDLKPEWFVDERATDIYIDFDSSKIDKANRQVLDELR